MSVHRVTRGAGLVRLPGVNDAGLVSGESTLAARVDADARVDVAPAAPIESLFAAHASRLIGALTVFTGSRSEAEDLAQEAFVRVLGARRPPQDSVKAVSYLYSVGFNLARSRWRRLATARRRMSVLGTRASHDSAEDRAIAAAGDATLLDAVEALPPRQRSCVVLHYYAELSVVETAEALGVSANTVKTQLRRALETLRQTVGEGETP